MRLRCLGAAVALCLALVGCGSPSGQASGGSVAAASLTTATTNSCPEPESVSTTEIVAAQAMYNQIDKLPDNNGPGTVQGAWSIKVVGDTSAGDVLKIKASGFPANGFYKTQVTNPDKTEYTYLCRIGRFDKNGTMPFWKWNHRQTDTGVPDPPGTYTLVITDITPGSPTINVPIETDFVIKELKK